MSTSNNRLCRLIAMHGRRDEPVFGKQRNRALKRRPVKRQVFNPTKLSPRMYKQHLEAAHKTVQALAERTELNRKMRMAAKRVVLS